MDGAKAIELALDNYACPYCRHAAKSSSGRTLHLKNCKAIAENEKAAAQWKAGMRVRCQAKDAKISHIKGGLAALDSGEVAPCTRLRKAEAAEFKPQTCPRIKDADEWVTQVVERCKGRGLKSKEIKAWVKTLYKVSGYPKYRMWKPEDITKALKGCGLGG